MVGDKRRIGFLGEQSQRELLESELYAGDIKSQERLISRAEELEIKLNISDDSQKVRKIGEVLVGEVKLRTPYKTRRKRIYATTSGYHMVELTGSKIETVKSGGSSIVLFGNKKTKEIANEAIKKHWKPKISLQDVGKIFSQVMEDVAKVSPSVSHTYDVLITHPQMNRKKAMELLRSTIIEDVKNLQKYRSDLREDMLKKSRDIQMASRIMTHGEVGSVKKVEGDEVEVVLSKGVEVLDMEWNILKNPGETVVLKMEKPSPLNPGDLVVIEDENLCIKRNKTNLLCDFIICKANESKNK